MDTISSTDVENAIGGLAQLTGLQREDVQQMCLSRTGGSPDPLIWAGAVQDVAAGLGVTLPAPDMTDEYVARFTPEAFLAREEAARATAQLSNEGLIDPDSPALTPEEANSEILRIAAVHPGSRIDTMRVASAVAAGPPVQLTQSSRSRYRDEDEGFESELSLSATHDGSSSAADEILALTSKYTAYFGGYDGSPRSALKIGAKGDQPSGYKATVGQREARHPQGSPEEIIARAARSRATAQMFGLSKLPSYEHDVTDPDFSSPDDDDAEATAAKINAIVGSHPDLFGREAPYGANVTIRGLSPRQREQDEVRALGGGRPGKYSLPDIAAGRLPTAR